MALKSIFKESPPPAKFKESLSEFYWHQLDLFADKILFVDYETNREWTGAQIKCQSTRIGHFLMEKLGLIRGDHCVFLYKNSDHAQILSIACLFAGASTCVWSSVDTISDHRHVLRTIEPKIVFADRFLRERLTELRNELNLHYYICLMDDHGNDEDLNGIVLGFRKHLLSYEPSKEGVKRQFPAHVEPDDAAYLLFTSGSTGLPKAVIRSHKNSIHVCHSLKTAPQLWDLNERSVVAGFQELDHGTGTFNTKMTLANGLKNIVMNGFNLEQLFQCIERHRVTDFSIGTAYLHNLMQAYCKEPDRYDLSSVKNMISIGAPLQSHSLKAQFMDLLPQVSVRQAYGMTECGFISLVSRDEARYDTTTVGYLLPTSFVKLTHLSSGETITDYDCEGELCAKGPTVSIGYYNPIVASDQARFQTADGFYRTNDICSFSKDGRIHIRGRCSEILIFTDGWKVLPSEIEAKLLEHPQIQEAAIIGVPHPELVGCHTARAYVVPKKWARGQLTERQVYDFAAANMSEPKHLNGGVKIMLELPRISVGKVDKKALRKMDGL